MINTSAIGYFVCSLELEDAAHQTVLNEKKYTSNMHYEKRECFCDDCNIYFIYSLQHI